MKLSNCEQKLTCIYISVETKYIYFSVEIKEVPMPQLEILHVSWQGVHYYTDGNYRSVKLILKKNLTTNLQLYENLAAVILSLSFI